MKQKTFYSSVVHPSWAASVIQSAPPTLGKRLNVISSNISRYNVWRLSQTSKRCWTANV